jgi:hypothetical protein
MSHAVSSFKSHSSMAFSLHGAAGLPSLSGFPTFSSPPKRHPAPSVATLHSHPLSWWVSAALLSMDLAILDLSHKRIIQCITSSLGPAVFFTFLIMSFDTQKLSFFSFVAYAAGHENLPLFFVLCNFSSNISS